MYDTITEISKKKLTLSEIKEDIISIIKYKDLILLLIKRDFVTFYKQTILGPIWYVVQPIVSALVLYVVFYRIAGMQVNNESPFLFYLSGYIVWMYFSENILRISDTFINNAGMFGKVYFPRLVVPISSSLAGLISFYIQFIVFIVFYIVFVITTNNSFRFEVILVLPVITLLLLISSMGIGLLISSLTTKYRDLRYVLRFSMQLWMFSSPVAYSSKQVPEKYLWLYFLNPVTPIIELLRYTFTPLSHELVIHYYLTSLLIIFIIFVLAYFAFKKIEKHFMDSI